MIDIKFMLNEDEGPLYEFECANRSFFEWTIQRRGEDYYKRETFNRIFQDLLEEQAVQRSTIRDVRQSSKSRDWRLIGITL